MDDSNGKVVIFDLSFLVRLRLEPAAIVKETKSDSLLTIREQITYERMLTKIYDKIFLARAGKRNEPPVQS